MDKFGLQMCLLATKHMSVLLFQKEGWEEVFSHRDNRDE